MEGELHMSEKQKLVEEIVEKAKKIPLESQKHILDVMNAMVFTRKVIEEKQKQNNRKSSLTNTERA